MKLVKEYHSYCECNSGSVIHLVETRPSYLRDVSWMCEFTAVRVSAQACKHAIRASGSPT